MKKIIMILVRLALSCGWSMALAQETVPPGTIDKRIINILERSRGFISLHEDIESPSSAIIYWDTGSGLWNPDGGFWNIDISPRIKRERQLAIEIDKLIKELKGEML